MNAIQLGMEYTPTRMAKIRKIKNHVWKVYNNITGQ